MSAKTMTFEATLRDRAGKGAARAVRRENQVPAVIYGANKEPVLISLAHNELIKELNKGGFYTKICDIKTGKDSHKVLARDIQFHPVSDMPQHIDFLRVTEKTKIVVNVPTSFVNEKESEGLNRGGILNVVRHDMEVLASAASIPETIEFDLSGMEIGDSLHLQDAKLPSGVTLTTEENFTVATVTAPSALKSSEGSAEGESEGEEGAEEASGEDEPAEEASE